MDFLGEQGIFYFEVHFCIRNFCQTIVSSELPPNYTLTNLLRCAVGVPCVAKHPLCPRYESEKAFRQRTPRSGKTWKRAPVRTSTYEKNPMYIVTNVFLWQHTEQGHDVKSAMACVRRDHSSAHSKRVFVERG